MKYAIYGISCCGKDTFIKKLLESGKFEGYKHPKGSESLNTIALDSFGKNFKELSASEKEDIRAEYAQKLMQKENIFADGHYCFPKDGKYEIVFTKKDAECYDSFFYLKAKPEDVKNRIKNSAKNQKFANLSASDIEAWQKNEISELRDICFKINKDFIVLDSDFESTIAFIEAYTTNYKTRNSYQQAIRLAEICKSKASREKIALFDCDRTIVKEDTGTDYFKANGASLEKVKEIFADDIYSQYQFWKYNQLHKNFTVQPSTNQFHFNPLVIEKISELRNNGYFIIGVTSGISTIWQQIFREYDIVDLMVSSDESLGITISDFVKGFLVQNISRDHEVFACGDSLTDIYMLESASKQGVIYAPGKTRSSVQEYLNTHPETKIKQFKQNPNQYNNIEVV